MPKFIIHGIIALTAVVLVSGCGVSARVYKKNVERVDQEMDGNAGYLMGTPSRPDRSGVSKTRETIVFEFEKEDPEAQGDLDAVIQEAEQALQETRKDMRRVQSQVTAEPRPRMRPVTPQATEIEPAAAATFIEYKIEKNDTLQKISKKFYDSYAKWMKIYEANKDVIKDPNRIKPGTVIRIPQE